MRGPHVRAQRSAARRGQLPVQEKRRVIDGAEHDVIRTTPYGLHRFNHPSGGRYVKDNRLVRTATLTENQLRRNREFC